MDSHTDSSSIATPHRPPSGVAGWLLAFAVVVFWRILMFVRMDGQGVLLLLERWTYWQVWIVVARLFLYTLETILPVAIIYVLLTKRRNAVRWTKFFIVSAPLTGFVGYFHDSPMSIYDFKFRILLTAITFSIPWYVYFSRSKRVRNTFLFTESLLPRRIDCPSCFAELELSDDERKSRNVACPECNKEIRSVRVEA